MSAPTVRMFPRSLAEAFADERATCGDPRVMRAIKPPHIVNTNRMSPDECVSTIQPEAAHAACEIEDPPQALTVNRWMRIKRAVRAWWIGRMGPARRKA